MAANDIDLEVIKKDWEAVAQYTVYRTEGYASRGTEVRTVLHANQPLQQAMLKVNEADELLRKEPGYRSYVMHRPLIGMELEYPKETRTAYLALRQVSQQV